MGLRDELLPLLDELRAIPGEPDFAFRRYQVWVRKTMYSGRRIGEGAASISETRLLVGGQDPKVREVRRKDVAAGTSEFVDAEYDIGPLTPEFATGGVSDEIINPARTATPTAITFVLKGPGLPSEGLLCQRVEDHLDRPLRVMIRVRSTGRKASDSRTTF